MAKKSIRLLLLIVNVVIALHELGTWGRAVERCEILLFGVVAREVKHQGTGERQTRIDLETTFDSGAIHPVSYSPRGWSCLAPSRAPASNTNPSCCCR